MRTVRNSRAARYLHVNPREDTAMTMTTPRFTAKMIGGDYKLIRDDTGYKVNRSLLTVLGAGVLLSGLTRHSSFGAVLTAVGGGLIYAGVTGRNPCTALMRAIESVGESP